MSDFYRDEIRFRWIMVGVAALFCGTFLWVAVEEYRAQEANEVRCEAAGGRYFQHGDKRDSGLCVRPDGLLWRVR